MPRRKSIADYKAQIERIADTIRARNGGSVYANRSDYARFQRASNAYWRYTDNISGSRSNQRMQNVNGMTPAQAVASYERAENRKYSNSKQAQYSRRMRAMGRNGG